MTNGNVSAGMTFEPVFVPETEIIVPLKAVPAKPVVPAGPEVEGKKSMVFNIETLGIDPLANRIITIGYQDSMVPNENPTIIMQEDEAEMIKAFLTVLKEGEYNELIGYNLSFDYRFILMKAMYYDIDCKEFYECGLYDLMQVAQQGKQSFVYNPQKAPNLSNLSDYLFGYPKPFTDVEMMKYYETGEFDKVLEFASGQITRTMALYWTFRKISENMIIPLTSGSVGSSSFLNTPNVGGADSLLTIPEANLPEMITLQCPTCLSEIEVMQGIVSAVCTVCRDVMKIKQE